VSPAWSDLTARARGLETHLLTREVLEDLAGAADLPDLAERMRGAGYLLPDEPAANDPGLLELSVRRSAARRLRALARWAGRRAGFLTLIFEDEDRRSLRAMVRGAASGAPAAQRLAGLIPTPALPQRALEELARQGSVARVAALLSAWKHPWAPAVASAARGAETDLLAVELAISKSYFGAALKAACSAGRSSGLVTWVRELIDSENIATALVLAAAGEDDLRPRHAFLEGGEQPDIVAFEEAVATRDPLAAAQRLATALHPSPLADIVRRCGTDAGALERELLRSRIARLTVQRRHDPLGVHAVLPFAQKLRAEALDMQRIIWGVALGAPSGLLAESLVAAQ
jgi:vacuolar-type H+-ATPase subunit C/Vma6